MMFLMMTMMMTITMKMIMVMVMMMMMNCVRIRLLDEVVLIHETNCAWDDAPIILIDSVGII